MSPQETSVAPPRVLHCAWTSPRSVYSSSQLWCWTVLDNVMLVQLECHSRRTLHLIYASAEPDCDPMYTHTWTPANQKNYHQPMVDRYPLSTTISWQSSKAHALKHARTVLDGRRPMRSSVVQNASVILVNQQTFQMCFNTNWVCWSSSSLRGLHLHTAWSWAMEQFTATSQRCWLTVQSVLAATKDIFVSIVEPRCSANYFNCAI